MPWCQIHHGLTIGGMKNAEKSQPPKLAALVVFGEAVRTLRKARGFSQEAFSDACGIDRSYMGGIERGEHNLALVNILKIIEALDMQPSEFFSALDQRKSKRPNSAVADIDDLTSSRKGRRAPS